MKTTSPEQFPMLRVDLPPEVTDTTMATDLLHQLKIITELDVQVVGQELRVLAVTDVLLSVQEPVGDLVVAWVLHDGDELLDLQFER